MHLRRKNTSSVYHAYWVKLRRKDGDAPSDRQGHYLSSGCIAPPGKMSARCTIPPGSSQDYKSAWVKTMYRCKYSLREHPERNNNILSTWPVITENCLFVNEKKILSLESHNLRSNTFLKILPLTSGFFCFRWSICLRVLPKSIMQ